MSARSPKGAPASSQHRIWFPDDSPYHPRRVSRLKHSFSEHPLMQLAALKALALKFEAQGNGLVKFQRTGARSADALEVLSQSDRGMSIEEIFDRIEEPRSWISLYNVGTDPEYREMIDQIMESVAHLTDAFDPGAFETDGFVFVSAPPSATPFHIDRENNFFLQLHGRKRMSVWHPDDRTVVPEAEIESKIGRGAKSTVPFRDEYFKRAAFDAELRAGEGVYMPSTAGHTTNTEALPEGRDDTYSVSIGIVFYTRATRRAAYVYAVNDQLRRLGLNPRAPFDSPVRDAVKYPLGRSMIFAKKVLRGFEVPPGM